VGFDGAAGASVVLTFARVAVSPAGALAGGGGGGGGGAFA
jgi:hypothetical protein